MGAVLARQVRKQKDDGMARGEDQAAAARASSNAPPSAPPPYQAPPVTASVQSVAAKSPEPIRGEAGFHPGATRGDPAAHVSDRTRE